MKRIFIPLLTLLFCSFQLALAENTPVAPAPINDLPIPSVHEASSFDTQLLESLASQALLMLR